MEINEIIEKLNLNMKHYIESYDDSSKLNINELEDSPLKNVLEGLISQLHANNSIQMCKELVESELFANAVKERIIRVPMEAMCGYMVTKNGATPMIARASKESLSGIINYAREHEQIIFPYLIGLVTNGGNVQNYYAMLDRSLFD